MEKVLISVIVSVYNIEAYLDECIESIINQTYPYLEIILVDDGSTDHSGAICDRYAAIDDRILVIHKENGGLVTARKAALAVAKGDYIGFVDGDDYVEPEFYEVLCREIKEKAVDFVQCGRLAEGGWADNIFPPCFVEEKHDISDRQEVIRRFLRNFFRHEGYISVNVWDKLFCRDFIKEHYQSVPDIQQNGEDFLCMCECLLHCRSFASIDKKLYHYRFREDSLSNDNSIKKFAGDSGLITLLKVKLSEYNCYFPEAEQFFNELFLSSLYNCRGPVTGEKFSPYFFPELEWLKGKKIVLYGAGMCGKGYYRQLSLYSQIKIVAWADKRAKEIQCDYMQIMTPDEIGTMDYDLLLIAVEDKNVAEKIGQELVRSGLAEDKIFWKEPGKLS